MMRDPTAVGPGIACIVIRLTDSLSFLRVEAHDETSFRAAPSREPIGARNIKFDGHLLTNGTNFRIFVGWDA